MPESAKYVWVVTHQYEYGEVAEVLAVVQSEEGKDKFLLRLMKLGKANGKPVNLNLVKATLVQMMQ